MSALLDSSAWSRSLVVLAFLLLFGCVVQMDGCLDKHTLVPLDVAGAILLPLDFGKQYCSVREGNTLIKFNLSSSISCNDSDSGPPTLLSVTSNFPSNGSIGFVCLLGDAGNTTLLDTTCMFSTGNISWTAGKCWRDLISFAKQRKQCDLNSSLLLAKNNCVRLSCNLSTHVQLPPRDAQPAPVVSFALVSANSSSNNSQSVKFVPKISECASACDAAVDISLFTESIMVNSSTTINVTIDFRNSSRLSTDKVQLNISISNHYVLTLSNFSCHSGNLTLVGSATSDTLTFDIKSVSTARLLICSFDTFVADYCQSLPVSNGTFIASLLLTHANQSAGSCYKEASISKPIELAFMNLSAAGHLNLTSNQFFIVQMDLFLRGCSLSLSANIDLPVIAHPVTSLENGIPLLQWDSTRNTNSSMFTRSIGPLMTDAVSNINNTLTITIRHQTGDVLSGRLSLDLAFVVSSHPNLTIGRPGILSLIDDHGCKPNVIFVIHVSHAHGSEDPALNLTVTDSVSGMGVSSVWTSPASTASATRSNVYNVVTIQSKGTRLDVGQNFTLRYKAIFSKGSTITKQFGAAAAKWGNMQVSSPLIGPVLSNTVCIEPQIQQTIKKEPAYGFIALGVFSGLFVGTIVTMLFLYIFRKTPFLKKLRIDFEISQLDNNGEGRDTTFHLSDGYCMDSSRETTGVNHEILCKDSYGYWACFAAMSSPGDADLLITRDMLHDLSKFQGRCAKISLLCWQSVLHAIANSLCRSSEISSDMELKVYSDIEQRAAAIMNEASIYPKETWSTMPDIVKTCFSIVNCHSVVVLNSQKHGQELLKELVSSSSLDGIAKKSLFDMFAGFNKYLTAALDKYMEDAYVECQRMAWKRRNMALLLSCAHDRYFVLIDWLVKKFLMELDLLQRKRLLSSEVSLKISASVKDLASKASVRYQLSVKTFLVNHIDKTATQFEKHHKTLESNWKNANSAVGEKLSSQSKKNQQTELEALIDKKLLNCQEIEKDMSILKNTFDDKALRRHLHDARHSTVDWFTTSMMKAATEVDGKRTTVKINVPHEVAEQSEVAQEINDNADYEFERTSVCDVISNTLQHAAQYDTVTEEELQLAHCSIQEQLNEELKVLDDCGTEGLQKEIRRKAKVIIRSVLSSCPCSGKSFIRDLFQRWDLSTTSRVIGRFLFNALKELKGFDSKLKGKKHSEFFLAILPSHTFSKLLDMQKQDLQASIDFLVAKVNEVLVKEPANADCIFKQVLSEMLNDLITDHSAALRKILHWQNEMEIMRDFFSVVAKSDLNADKTHNESEALQRCLGGYVKDVNTLLAIDFDTSQNLSNDDKNELDSILSSFLDHVNRVAGHSQSADFDLDFILLDENETLRAMMSLAADSTHLDKAIASIIAIESKNVECFGMLYKMNVLPRSLFNDTLKKLMWTVSTDRMTEILTLIFGKAKPVEFLQEITRRECRNMITEMEQTEALPSDLRRRIKTSDATNEQ